MLLKTVTPPGSRVMHLTHCAEDVEAADVAVEGGGVGDLDLRARAGGGQREEVEQDEHQQEELHQRVAAATQPEVIRVI